MGNNPVDIKTSKSVRFNPNSDHDVSLYHYAMSKHDGNFSGFVKKLIEADRMSGGLLYRLADEVLSSQLKQLIENGGSLTLQAATVVEEEPSIELSVEDLDGFL